jgi:PAS domain S-box-containing protein
MSLREPRWKPYLVALLITSAALGLRMRLAPWFGDRPLLLLFVPCVYVSAAVGGLAPGLLATAIAALGTSYFLIPAVPASAIAGSLDSWDRLSLILLGVLISTLTAVRPTPLRGVPHSDADAKLQVEKERLEARVIERTRALRQSEARLGGIVSSAMDAIISVNREQRIVLFNLAAENLFGYRAGAVLGQELAMLIPEKLRESHRQHVQSFGSTGVTSRSMRSLRPLVALRADGTEFPIEASISQVEVAGESIYTVILRDVGERTRAQAAAAWLTAIVASSSDAIVSKDLQGNVTSWNAGAQRMFGYLATEIIGRPITTLIPVAMHDEEKAILRQIRQGESIRHFETVRLRKDGSSIQISVTVSPIVDENGRIVGASKVARDITERKLEEARAVWLSSFPERNPSPIVELDPLENVIHYSNPAALEQFPTLEAEGLQHPLLTGVQALSAQLPEGGTLQRELSVGQAHFSQLLSNVSGTSRVRIYSTDITARRDAERALREREAELHASDRRLAEIVHGMTEACFAVDSEWRFSFVNDRLESLLHQHKAQMLGHTIWSLFPKLVGTMLEASCRRAMSERVPLAFELYAPEIERWLDVRLFSTGDGLAAFLLDIHDRKLAELEVLRLNRDLERRVLERTEQLEAANKELEAFSYSVSHDLRAPLRAVSGFSRIVTEDYGAELPTEAKAHLQKICDGAARMGTLIDDLLAFARLSRLPLSKQSVNAEQQARDALCELQPEYAGHALEVRIGQLAPCHGDPALLKQVWVNLLSNALKYSKNRDPAVIEIGSASELDSVVYFVRDNGTGFDMRYADKLFGVFQRLHREEDFAGTGVGLAIVHRIVTRHGGRIWASAAPNQGATFHFSLPAART